VSEQIFQGRFWDHRHLLAIGVDIIGHLEQAIGHHRGHGGAVPSAVTRHTTIGTCRPWGAVPSAAARHTTIGTCRPWCAVASAPSAHAGHGVRHHRHRHTTIGTCRPWDRPSPVMATQGAGAPSAHAGHGVRCHGGWLGTPSAHAGHGVRYHRHFQAIGVRQLGTPSAHQEFEKKMYPFQ
jgi:hypothetical protein